MRIAARAEGLTKTYGTGASQVTAIDDVYLSVMVGRLTAIMGPSGSGKSTLLQLLAALDTPTSGEVWLGDQAISGLSDTALTKLRRQRVGLIFESFNLVPTLTAYDNIALPLRIAGKRVDHDWLEHIIGALGLGRRLGHKPAQLTSEQQQRVACARALANQPHLVFADEPTGNLNSNAAAKLLGFLRYSVDELGQSVLIATHDPMVASYADRIVFLRDGRIMDELRKPTTEAVLNQMARLYPQAQRRSAPTLPPRQDQPVAAQLKSLPPWPASAQSHAAHAAQWDNQLTPVSLSPARHAVAASASVPRRARRAFPE